MKRTELYYTQLILSTLSPLENRKGKIKDDEISCCCPFHDDKKPSFGINLHSGLYNCCSCGESGNIVKFLSKMNNISEQEAKELVIKEVGFIDINKIPYSLDEFSTEKRLPIQFLKDNGIDSLNGQQIVFPYYNENKELVKARYRNNPKSDIRFFWSIDGPTCLYGLWKLKEFKNNYIILVEGETDSLSLWYHDIPALGVPGANNFKREYSKLLKDFGKIIIHLEDDEASKKFMKKICQSGIPYDKLYKLSSHSIDEKCKDPSDLHIKNLLDEKTLLDNIHKIDKDYFDEINKGQFSTQEHVKIAEEVLEQLYIKFYKENFYVYESGVYKEGKAKIEECIISIDKNIKRNTRAEILDYLRIKEGVRIVDIDKNLINFKNGIYHIDTNTLESHTPKVFTLCQINANYLSDDELEELKQTGFNNPIDNFLSDVCCGHIDRINTLQEFIGYSMTYIVSLAKCLFLVGETASNGKSTFIELITILFGEDNYSSVSLADISERFCGSELSNKLLNIIHEISDVKVKDIAKFKAIITGDTLSVEEKYKPRYKIKPFAHHIFAMNNLPEIANGDEGFFRRIQIVPFENKFDEEQQANFNFDELVTSVSLDYLANISLRKYIKMKAEHRKKFSNYKESDELVSGYKNGDNSIVIFLQDIFNYASLIDTNNNKIIIKELYEEYCKWCMQNKFEPFTRREVKKIALGSGLFTHSKGKNGFDCIKYIGSNTSNVQNSKNAIDDDFDFNTWRDSPFMRNRTF